MKTFLVFNVDVDVASAHNLPVSQFSIPLSSEAEIGAAQTLLGIADLTDSTPGDGKLEVSTEVKVPIKLHLGFLNINQALPIHVDAVASIQSHE